MEFNSWLYTAVVIYCNGKKDPHEIFPIVDLTDAKLSFIDGLSPIEYSQELKTKL